MNVYILKISFFVQILFDVNLNFIKQFNFLEIFCDVDGINLSEKCVNVSCCIVLVSNMSKKPSILLGHALQWKDCHKHGRMAGLPFSADSCVLSMCGQFGVWSWQSLVCCKVVELCCTNSLLDLDVFRKVCFWFLFQSACQAVQM